MKITIGEFEFFSVNVAVGFNGGPTALAFTLGVLRPKEERTALLMQDALVFGLETPPLEQNERPTTKLVVSGREMPIPGMCWPGVDCESDVGNEEPNIA